MDAAGVRVHGGMEEACLRLGEDSEPWNQDASLWFSQVGNCSSAYDEEEAEVYCQHGSDCKLPPSWGTRGWMGFCARYLSRAWWQAERKVERQRPRGPRRGDLAKNKAGPEAKQHIL